MRMRKTEISTDLCDCTVVVKSSHGGEVASGNLGSRILGADVGVRVGRVSDNKNLQRAVIVMTTPNTGKSVEKEMIPW